MPEDLKNHSEDWFETKSPVKEEIIGIQLNLLVIKSLVKYTKMGRKNQQ